MKIRTLLITTILSTGLAFSNASPSLAADTITTDTVKTATAPISKEAIEDPRVAAANFVEHINYARVALAMKNSELAKQHISQARSMVALIESAPSAGWRITEVESGRIVYEYDTAYKYHYFPIETGPIQVKEMSNGPIWTKNDLAVTDADIVYLTLDLTGDNANDFLDEADAAIVAKDLKEADNQLAKLTEEVVTVDSQVSVPSTKARDNIALARNFIAGKNYDGASFALKHADAALDEMQKDDDYKIHHDAVISMRKDVSELQDYITKKDPNLIQKADTKMEKWWKELKSWSGSEKNSSSR